MIDPFQTDTYLTLEADRRDVATLMARIRSEFASHDAASDRIQADRADIFAAAGDVFLDFKRRDHARDLEYTKERYDGR